MSGAKATVGTETAIAPGSQLFTSDCGLGANRAVTGYCNFDMEFADRSDAGRRLAARVIESDLDRPVIVAMPRGGVPVAAEVAVATGAPLDIAVVRKVGAPSQPEYALAAVAEEGVSVVNETACALTGIGENELTVLIDRAREELDRRVSVYRAECPPIDLTGRTAVLVDDGLATGATAAAAARALKRRGAASVVLAVPVCSKQSMSEPPDPSINRVLCLASPSRLISVGYWYRIFTQVSDEEVLDILHAACARGGAG